VVIKLSRFRPIDNFTEGDLDESVKSAAIVFGITHAINAAVSVMQSAEVGFEIASVSPGDALDPMTDQIKHFSEALTFKSFH
jgi:hypothetical protein